MLQSEARLIFMWSRIRSRPDLSDAALVRLRSLSFEDFLEALVRTSTLLALPTDEDLAEVGVPDAGAFMLTLGVKVSG